MLNCIVLQGRLVADPELRQTPQGVSVCRFTLACDRSYAKAGTERQTDFLDVNVWRNTAEFVCKYFHKGDMMLVEGRLQTGSYQDKETGKNRKTYDIEATNINFCGGRGNGNGQSAGGGDYSRQATQQDAPVAYSAGNSEDFKVIDDSISDDSTDLPF